MWSDLPGDLLHIIMQKLDDPFDIYRCARTCVSWRLVATTILSPPHVLLLRSVGQEGSNEYFGPCFNVQTNRTHEVSLPEVEGRWFSGSSFGWLLTIELNKYDNIRLLNPITRDQIQLPPMNHSQLPDSWPIEFTYDYLSVITSTSPSNPDCLVLAAHCYFEELAYCRPGDMSWTTINSRRIFGGREANIIFYQNNFYALSFTGTLFRVNCFTSDVKRVSLQPIKFLQEDSYIFFLVKLGDHLLMVARCIYGWCEVYKLNWVDKKWIRMESIGNYAIILNWSRSKSLIVDGHSTNLKANCIYSIHYHGFSFYDMATKRMCYADEKIAPTKLFWFKAN